MAHMKIAFRSLVFVSTFVVLAGCARSTEQFSSPSDSTILPTTAGPIDKLKQGNARFVSGHAQHPNQGAAKLKEVAPHQHPFAIVVSCSDSRVPPELVFDQGVGDLFVVRTAGHVIDKAAMASIEYAVEHLGAESLVVMGHESCGAVKAAMSTPVGKSAGSPSLDSLVGAIRPDVKGFELNTPDDPTLIRPVTAHVNSVARDLVESSHIIKEFVEHKKLYFARSLYNLENGSVTFWGEGYPEVSNHVTANKAHSSAYATKKKPTTHVAHSTHSH
jgi:carbonic anhydrase